MNAAEYRKRMGLPPAGDTPLVPNSKPSIRLAAPVKMTKVEAEYEHILKMQFPICEVWYERVTFRLPGGSRYCPDFTVWENDRLVLVVETKGAFRLGSAGRSHTAFKECIAAMPDIRFRFAQKSKEGWKTVEANT